MENPPPTIEGLTDVNTSTSQLTLVNDIKALQAELTKEMEPDNKIELMREALALLARDERERKARTVKVMGVNIVCMTQNEYLTGVQERLTW